MFENGTDIPLTDHLLTMTASVTNLTACSLSLVDTAPPRCLGGYRGLSYVLVWSEGPVQFACIEPWHGLPDAATTGEWLKAATVRLRPTKAGARSFA
ncbi:MAG: hypothetical protein ACLRWF_05550 [Ruthenibacterium sp.]